MSTQFSLKQRVRHKQRGEGTIRRIEGDTIYVQFDIEPRAFKGKEGDALYGHPARACSADDLSVIEK